jgi:hypothetical protein
VHAQECRRYLDKLKRVTVAFAPSAARRGSANEAELNHILRQHLLIRRLKKARKHVIYYF